MIFSQENHAPELIIWPDTIAELGIPHSIFLEAKDEDYGDTLSFLVFQKPDWSELEILCNNAANLKGIPRSNNLLKNNLDTIIIGVSDGKDTAIHSIRLHYLPWQPPTVHCVQGHNNYEVVINTEFETEIMVNHISRINDFRIRVTEIPEWIHVEYRDSVNIHLSGIPLREGIYTANFIVTDTYDYIEHEILVKVINTSSGISQIPKYYVNNESIIISQKSYVSIYDMCGNLLLKSENRNFIDLSFLNPGLYIVRGNINNEVIISKIFRN